MNERERTNYKNEFELIDKLDEVSKKLLKMEIDKRPPALVDMLKEMKIPEGLYIPSNPNYKIISIDAERSVPLKSHARVPILVNFTVYDEDAELAEQGQASTREAPDNDDSDDNEEDESESASDNNNDDDSDNDFSEASDDDDSGKKGRRATKKERRKEKKERRKEKKQEKKREKAKKKAKKKGKKGDKNAPCAPQACPLLVHLQDQRRRAPGRDDDPVHRHDQADPHRRGHRRVPLPVPRLHDGQGQGRHRVHPRRKEPARHRRVDWRGPPQLLHQQVRAGRHSRVQRRAEQLHKERCALLARVLPLPGEGQAQRKHHARRGRARHTHRLRVHIRDLARRKREVREVAVQAHKGDDRPAGRVEGGASFPEVLKALRAVLLRSEGEAQGARGDHRADDERRLPMLPVRLDKEATDEVLPRQELKGRTERDTQAYRPGLRRKVYRHV
ncbi:hypothetical protein M9Y10_000003 [Tritrichomonas musculus]|uniref:Uncharacterized protein n=1 Tax=Tritrichomonas musculus TaxID=1915356 RepID=A0ABR2L336_9EUKA